MKRKKKTSKRKKAKLNPSLYGKAIKDLSKIYGKPLIGGHRVVFINGDEVIKVPYKESGEIANEIELEGRPKNAPPEAKFAKTKLDNELSNKYGFLIIRMERIKDYFTIRMPEWTYDIDCCQVGINKRGELVAYDWEEAPKG